MIWYNIDILDRLVVEYYICTRMCVNGTSTGWCFLTDTKQQSKYPLYSDLYSRLSHRISNNSMHVSNKGNIEQLLCAKKKLGSVQDFSRWPPFFHINFVKIHIFQMPINFYVSICNQFIWAENGNCNLFMLFIIVWSYIVLILLLLSNDLATGWNNIKAWLYSIYLPKCFYELHQNMLVPGSQV